MYLFRDYPNSTLVCEFVCTHVRMYTCVFIHECSNDGVGDVLTCSLLFLLVTNCGGYTVYQI